MCFPSLFSACGSLIDKLTCNNRCNWRCCTRDHITQNFNGPVDEKTQAVAIATIEGGPPEPAKEEESVGGLPPFLAKFFKKKEKAPSINSRGGESAAAGQGDGRAPVMIQPLPPCRKRMADDGERQVSGGVSEIECIVLTDLTGYLFRVLKNESNTDVLINTYGFSQEMANEIRCLFEKTNFRLDLTNKQRVEMCSIETLERLTIFEKKHQIILAASREKHPNP